jgi:hypothetical protein
MALLDVVAGEPGDGVARAIAGLMLMHRPDNDSDLSNIACSDMESAAVALAESGRSLSPQHGETPHSDP